MTETKRFGQWMASIAADFVGGFEGFVDHVYMDIAGHRTIGFGHMDDRLPLDKTITREQALTLLASDLCRHQIGLAAHVTRECTRGQFIALLSMAFNVGVSPVRKSTLLRKFNAGDIAGAADEFLRWDRAGGKVVVGLTRRREAERKVFLED